MLVCLLQAVSELQQHTSTVSNKAQMVSDEQNLQLTAFVLVPAALQRALQCTEQTEHKIYAEMR